MRCEDECFSSGLAPFVLGDLQSPRQSLRICYPRGSGDPQLFLLVDPEIHKDRGVHPHSCAGRTPTVGYSFMKEESNKNNRGCVLFHLFALPSHKNTLTMNYQEILTHIYEEIQPFAKEGKQADYIPALAKVDPDQFGICIHTIDGETFALQKAETRFSIQSISKVFALAMCLGLEGDELWKRMGKEPSGTAFNSLIQLEEEHGIPRNPFINAGAIVMADILLTRLQYPRKEFITFIRTLCGNKTVNYNEEVAASERSQGYLNAAIANMLKYHHNIDNDIEEVLHFYFQMCSVEMSCHELSKAFLAFANHKQPFDYAGIQLTSSQVKRMNAIMQTFGFYDEAGEFSYLVGLPGKSGVGGGIVAIYPSRYSVAVWSPRLNSKGNSVMGMKALELLTTETKESIF